MGPEEILAALLAKADAGALPAKKANMLKVLQAKVGDGKLLSEMQIELLDDLGRQFLA